MLKNYKSLIVQKTNAPESLNLSAKLLGKGLIKIAQWACHRPVLDEILLLRNAYFPYIIILHSCDALTLLFYKSTASKMQI